MDEISTSTRASSINQEMHWEQQFMAKEEFLKYFQRLLHRWKINTEREGDMFKTEHGLFTLFSAITFMVKYYLLSFVIFKKFKI
jgi:hypothetical protein